MLGCKAQRGTNSHLNSCKIRGGRNGEARIKDWQARGAQMSCVTTVQRSRMENDSLHVQCVIHFNPRGQVQLASIKIPGGHNITSLTVYTFNMLAKD